jgi:hypothetical protein
MIESGLKGESFGLESSCRGRLLLRISLNTLWTRGSTVSTNERGHSQFRDLVLRSSSPLAVTLFLNLAPVEV